jgi:CxxC-x17-CxxC domain-containing protein
MEAEGTAITFVTHEETGAFADIKSQTNMPITELTTSVDVKKGPAKKFKAICRKCKKEFEMPFKPTDGRPVYCLPCLKSKKRNSRTRGSGGSRRHRGRNNRKH